MFSCVTYYMYICLTSLSEYGSKSCCLNDKKQVFILKFYLSDVWIVIDNVKYNRSSKIKLHFDQFSYTHYTEAVKKVKNV